MANNKEKPNYELLKKATTKVIGQEELKNLPVFSNLKDLKQYLIKDGFDDKFVLNGKPYSVEEYDFCGKEFRYASIDANIRLIIKTEDRYLSREDLEIEVEEGLDYVRSDAVYYTMMSLENLEISVKNWRSFGKCPVCGESDVTYNDDSDITNPEECSFEYECNYCGAIWSEHLTPSSISIRKGDDKPNTPWTTVKYFNGETVNKKIENYILDFNFAIMPENATLGAFMKSKDLHKDGWELPLSHAMYNFDDESIKEYIKVEIESCKSFFTSVYSN